MVRRSQKFRGVRSLRDHLFQKMLSRTSKSLKQCLTAPGLFQVKEECAENLPIFLCAMILIASPFSIMLHHCSKRSISTNAAKVSC